MRAPCGSDIRSAVTYYGGGGGLNGSGPVFVRVFLTMEKRSNLSVDKTEFFFF